MLKQNKNLLILIFILIIMVIFYKQMVSKKGKDLSYDNYISRFQMIKVEEVEEMINNSDKFLLYIGRESCSACLDFVPVLAKIVDKFDMKVYYLDTSYENKDKALAKFQNKYNIGGVPSLIVSVDGQLYYPKTSNDEKMLVKGLKALKFLE